MRYKSIKNKRRSRHCQHCGYAFLPSISLHRLCSPCMEASALQAPLYADNRPLARSFGNKPLSHVERTAAGLSAATPGGWSKVIDAGRTGDAFGLTLVELARGIGCNPADLTPSPPPKPKSPYGAIRMINGLIRAIKCAGGWRAQIGISESTGIRWQSVGTLRKTKEDAIKLASEVRR